MVCIIFISNSYIVNADNCIFEDKAVILGNLGLADGKETNVDGSKIFEFENMLDRQTAVCMLIKLFGYTKEAKSLSNHLVSNTLDAYTDKNKISSWARNYMVYAIINKMIKGTSKTTLEPMINIDAKSYSTMILRQLGYNDSKGDFNWKTAADNLADKGGLPPNSLVSNYEFNNLLLNYDYMYGFSYGALFAKNKIGKTLASILVEKGVLTTEQLQSQLGEEYNKINVSEIKNNILDVPYISQYNNTTYSNVSEKGLMNLLGKGYDFELCKKNINNYFDGSWACAPTSAVMVLSYLEKLKPSPCITTNNGETNNYARYISQNYTFNNTIFDNLAVQVYDNKTMFGYGAWGYIWKNGVGSVFSNLLNYLKLHSVDSQFISAPSKSMTEQLVVEQITNKKMPIIARTLMYSDSGHYLLIIGYNNKDSEFKYIVNDPANSIVKELTYDEIKISNTESRGLIIINDTNCDKKEIFNIDDLNKMKIKLGMSFEDVKSIFGEPNNDEIYYSDYYSNYRLSTNYDFGTLEFDISNDTSSSFRKYYY
jgi:hypothetical protein